MQEEQKVACQRAYRTQPSVAVEQGVAQSTEFASQSPASVGDLGPVAEHQRFIAARHVPSQSGMPNHHLQDYRLSRSSEATLKSPFLVHIPREKRKSSKRALSDLCMSYDGSLGPDPLKPSEQTD